MKKEKTTISEFFKTAWALSLFTIKTLWLLVTTDMKKEAQTYREEREEREEQKKRARNEEKKSR